jgi:hypothetical protein
MHTRFATDPDRRFFLLMSAVAFAVVLVGFAPTYYLKPLFGTPAIKPFVHFHAAAFTAWCVLLIAQPLLIRRGNVRLHRRLGVLGVGIAAVVVTTGYLVIFGKPRPTEFMKAFILMPMMSLLMFSLCVAAGVWYRRDPPTHKRLMYLSLLFIVGAGMSRTLRMMGVDSQPHLSHVVTDCLLLVPLIAYDLVRLRTLQRATAWGIAAAVIVHPVYAAFAYTPQWQRIAAWLTNS